MKFMVPMFLGMLVGIVLTALLVLFNPLNAPNTLSPIVVTDNEVITLNYSAVPGDSLLLTNNGEARTAPHPAKVLQLWEMPIRNTSAMATILADSRGNAAGIGIKIASDSEQTSLIDAAALVDSVWHVYLPGRGALFVTQTENYWTFLRDIVIPAYWSSSDAWKGTWRNNMTVGPNALGTARVVGGSGKFANLEAEAIEALSARAYAIGSGPVAADGQLVIELPMPVGDAAAYVED